MIIKKVLPLVRCGNERCEVQIDFSDCRKKTSVHFKNSFSNAVHELNAFLQLQMSATVFCRWIFWATVNMLVVAQQASKFYEH